MSSRVIDADFLPVVAPAAVAFGFLPGFLPLRIVTALFDDLTLIGVRHGPVRREAEVFLDDVEQVSKRCFLA
jgi:hypothetical protein